MKTIIKPFNVTNLLIVATALMFAACNSNTTAISDNKVLPPQDYIDLTDHAMRKTLGDSQITAFSNGVLINNCQNQLPPVIDSMKIGEFSVLKKAATAFYTPGDVNHVLALKIVYGLDLQNRKIDLRYKAVYLKRIGYNTESKIAEYASNESTSYYIHANNTFTTTTDIGCVSTYSSNIKFKQPNGICLGFNDAMDSTGSVRSLVFSFQEIDSVINGNKSKYVYILNAAENIKVSGNNYFKHSLLLAPDTLSHHVIPIFYMKYGNLSHLCPPSCNNLSFKLK